MADLTERERALLAALDEILYLRPAGDCKNTLVVQMETIAKNASYGISAGTDRQSNDEPSECRYCDNSGWYYSEPDLGPCVCAPTALREENARLFDALNTIANSAACLPGYSIAEAAAIARAAIASAITEDRE